MGYRGEGSKSFDMLPLMKELAKLKSMVDVCQLCDTEGHIARSCPWVYTHCHVPNCLGIMKLTEDSQGAIFMKCHLDGCHGFKYLSSAMKEMKETEKIKHKLHMLEDKHKMNMKELKDWPCPRKNCTGSRLLLVSKTPQSSGLPFLKCPKCQHFEGHIM